MARKNPEKLVKISAQLPSDILTRIRNEAKRDDVSDSQVIRRAMRAYFGIKSAS